MSKKNKHLNQNLGAAAAPAGSSEAAEFTVIKRDLWQVLVLNVVYLAAVLAVYLTNNRSHYLERVFGKLFGF